MPEMMRPAAEVTAAAPGPGVARKGHLGGAGKQESGDSAYGEGGEEDS